MAHCFFTVGKALIIATLFISESGELCLVLRGEAEDRILTTVRRWPYWQRADIERDAVHPDQCIAVTLVTDRVHEQTVRSILKMSFGLQFPTTGGSSDIVGVAPAVRRSRRDR